MMTIIVILNYFESIVHMFLSLSLYFLNTFYLKQIDYVDSTFKVRTGTRRYKDDAIQFPTHLSKDLHSVQKSHTQKGSPLGLMLCWHHLENVNDFVFEHLFCKVWWNRGTDWWAKEIWAMNASVVPWHPFTYSIGHASWAQNSSGRTMCGCLTRLEPNVRSVHHFCDGVRWGMGRGLL